MLKVSKSRAAMAALALTMGFVATTASALKITIGGGGDARDVDLTKSYDFSADPASTAATYIVARGTPKNVQKVALVSFCVSLVDGHSVSGSSGPFTASSSSGFPGQIDSQRLAGLLDGYRTQFVADLRAAGITVLEPAELAALPSYQKLAAKMTTEPYEVSDSYEVGKGTWANNRVQVMSPGGQPMFKDCRALAPGTTMNLVRAAYQKDLADVTLLIANVTLDYAKAKAAGGFFRGAKADLDYGQYIAPGIESTAFAFIGKGGGTLWLKQAIVAGQNPFAEGAKGERKTDVKMDNEYKPDSAYTRTSSQATTVSSDMDLWYSNAANELKALSGMLAHALKTSK